MIADAQLVPDPEAITQEFNRESAALLKAVRARSERAKARQAGPRGDARHAVARTAGKMQPKRPSARAHA